MKLFGPQFEVEPLSCYPTEAQAFDNLAGARAAYAYFIEECDGLGQHPADAYLYVGEPAGDEERLGYPDYPDYRVWKGERGGICVRKMA